MMALKFGVLAGALSAILLAPLAASADAITYSFSFPTESFPLDVGHAIYPSSDPFPQFNPATGTLNVVSLTVTGNATWTSPYTDDSLDVDFALGGWYGPGMSFSSPGIITLNLAAGCTPESYEECALSLG